MEKFLEMQRCFNKYPNLYQVGDKEDNVSEINGELAGNKKE